VRADFFRAERFPAADECLWPEDFGASAADAVEPVVFLGWAWEAGVFEVAGFVVVSSLLEPGRAPAEAKHGNIARAPSTMNRAARI